MKAHPFGTYWCFSNLGCLRTQREDSTWNPGDSESIIWSGDPESEFSTSATSDADNLLIVFKTLHQSYSPALVQYFGSDSVLSFQTWHSSGHVSVPSPLTMWSGGALQGLSNLGKSLDCRHHNPDPGQLFVVYLSVSFWWQELLHILLCTPRKGLQDELMDSMSHAWAPNPSALP